MKKLISLEGRLEMDIGSLLGIIVGFGMLLLAFFEEGGSPGALLSVTSIMIVFGGTIGAVVLSFPVKTLKKVPDSFKKVFITKKSSIPDLIIYFKEVSTLTRRNGLLSLEGELGKEEVDQFIKDGLQMVADGFEPDLIKDILETKIQGMIDKNKEGIHIFDAAGGFSPTMGIIGTVMGLVNVLSNLADPESLGPKIATAFIATLYGVAFANLLWLPIGSRLKALNEQDVLEKEVMLQGILMIQNGVNPNSIVAKLSSFVEEGMEDESKKEVE
ncbi:flagellar motor protein [Clostridium paridis]